MNKYDVGFIIFVILFFVSICGSSGSLLPVFFAMMAFVCALDSRAKRRKQ